MISTRDLTSLSGIDDLKRLCQSLAVLDAILEPQWDMRYYSFDSQWADGEMMASMRNGSGDDYFLLFNCVGAILKGYAHEAPFAEHFVRAGRVWPGVLEEIPDEFAAFLSEPAFSAEEATFCLWRTSTDLNWRTGKIDFPPGNDPDGSTDLLSILDGRPETYQYWAEEYFERPVLLSCVSQIYQHQPLTAKMVRDLNPETSLRELKADLEEIGYPYA
jgi:hypothetical protein